MARSRNDDDFEDDEPDERPRRRRRRDDDEDDEYEGGGGGKPPQNYLVQSILVTLCCCLPFGVAGIVFAAQVNSKWQSGDYSGARDAAAKAKKFSTIGAISGIVINILVIVGQVILTQQQGGR